MSNSISIQDLIGKPSTSKQVLEQLEKHPTAYSVYCALPEKHQQNFLDFCSGKTSLYLCYDSFFHYIFDTNLHKNRIENLLSALLGQRVHVLEILPREGSQISEMGSFVVVDLLVRLEDQSLVDLEIQKAGYHFPASRMDCYCSDLIMREYNRLSSLHKEQFNFRMLHPVIAIVLMEHSPSEFHATSDIYVYRGQTMWDNNLSISGLTRQVFICLDKFNRVMQNKDIKNELEAWLTLLTCQNLTRIDKLLTKFPEFENIYKDIFEFRTKPEELIGMYSEALLVADRNMEREMIEEARIELAETQKTLEKSKKDLAESQKDLAESKKDLAESKKDLAKSQKDLAEKDQLIADLQEEIRRLKEK